MSTVPTPPVAPAPAPARRSLVAKVGLFLMAEEAANPKVRAAGKALFAALVSAAVLALKQAVGA